MKLQRLVQSPPHNCFLHFGRIPDEPQFNALVNECDVLFVVYEDFPYSSNMLTKAAIFKKTVVASETFCIGERVRKFELGLTIPEGDVAKCIEALHHLCSPESNTHLLNPDFEGYQRLNSLEQLHHAFLSILDTI